MHHAAVQKGCFSAELLQLDGSEASVAAAADLRRRLDFGRAGIAGANALARLLAWEGLSAIKKRVAAAGAIAAASGGPLTDAAGRSPWHLALPGAGAAEAAPLHRAADQVAPLKEHLQRVSASYSSVLQALSWTCAVMLSGPEAVQLPSARSSPGSDAALQELRCWRVYAAALRSLDDWLALTSSPLPPGPDLPPQIRAEYGITTPSYPRSGGSALPPFASPARIGAAWGGAAAAATAAHVSDFDRARFTHAIAMHRGVVEARRKGVESAAAAAFAAIRAVLECPAGFLHVNGGPQEEGEMCDADALCTAAVLEADDPVVIDAADLKCIPRSDALRRHLIPMLAMAYLDVAEGSIVWLRGDALAAQLGAAAIETWSNEASGFHHAITTTIDAMSPSDGQEAVARGGASALPLWTGELLASVAWG